MTVGSPAFYLALYLTGVHFRGPLQHGGHVGEQTGISTLDYKNILRYLIELFFI